MENGNGLKGGGDAAVREEAGEDIGVIQLDELFKGA
jgi:hypothetical protein